MRTGEKLRNTAENDLTYYFKQTVYQLIFFAAGALTASINDLGAFSPFGVAFTAAAPQRFLISSGLGAAAGYILSQDSVSALRYIAALVAAAVLSRLTQEFERIKKFKLLPSCIAFLTSFLTSTAVLLAGASDVKTFFIYCGEALLSAGAAYFFSSAAGAVKSCKEVRGFSVRDLSSVVITAELFLLSLSGISFFGVSFSRIAAVIIILVFSYIFKEAGGAVAGIAAGLIFSMDKTVGAVGMTYAVAGLISGVFSYANRFVSAGVFLLSFGAAFLFGDGSVDKIYMIIEAGAAAVIFMSVPEKYIRKIESLIVKKQPEMTGLQRQAVRERLKSASFAVGEMSQSVLAASGVLKRTDANDFLFVYNNVKDSVCDGCRLIDFCWNKNFRDCKNSFDVMSDILKNDGIVNQDNAPQYLKGCCVKLGALIDGFNKSYINYAAALSSHDKIEKIRLLTNEQFGGICSMLSELSEEFADGVTFDDKRAQRIDEMLFNGFSLKPESVVCLTDTDGRLKIEISFNEKLSDINESELKQSLEEICGRELGFPSVESRDRGVRICFCEKTKYRVAASATRIAADRENLCGDSYESFYDGRGNYTVVLSDGMGTGIRAAVDSSLASGLTSRLLRAGFSYGSALRLVNSALMLKSKDESLATLDVMSIDLYTGNVKFYKAGAAPSFVKRRSKINEIKLASMPVGILNETDFAETEARLSQDDLIIMASDGAFEYSGDAVKNGLAVTLSESTGEITERIAKKAKDEKKNSRCDDITVIAVRLLPND